MINLSFSLIHPVLAKPLLRDGWVYEEKYDGWRVLAYTRGRQVRLVSRRGVHHTKRFAELVATMARLPARTLVLDGEVCAFDEALVAHFFGRRPGARVQPALPISPARVSQKKRATKFDGPPFALRLRHP
jgi:ATP-dependent DNA ligase